MKRTFRKYPSNYIRATHIQGSSLDTDPNYLYDLVIPYIKDDVEHYLNCTVFTFNAITDLNWFDFIKYFIQDIASDIYEIYIDNVSKDEWHYYLDAYISKIHKERPNMHPDYLNQLSDTLYDFISRELVKIDEKVSNYLRR